MAAVAVAATLLAQFAGTAAVRADTATIREYRVASPLQPSWRDAPDAIVRGPDGNLWFTETTPQRIGRITLGGVVTQFAVAGHPTGITVGPDGNLWFIEPQDKLVGRMSPDGTVLNQFPVPWLFYPQGPIEGITTGPDNHVWISDPVTNMIGWIDTTGAITAYKVSGGPFALTPGPDGNLWYTEWFADKIAKLDPATGTVLAEYQIPRAVSTNDRTGLADIVTGPDHNLWLTEQYDNKIGRITPGGDFTLFPVPTGNGGPVGITAGPDSNLWFAESTGNRIGQITPAGDITEVHVPTARSMPLDIATGPDRNLWFTESGASQIARLDPTTIVPPPRPCLVLTASLTLNHDVGPCPGVGIVVRADNITLNLNGHKVYAAAGPRFGDFPGILLGGVNGVTVANGTVTGFDAGVALEGGSANTLTGLNVHHNLSAPDPASDYGDGIVLFHSGANTIAHNVVAYNGIYDGIGVLGLDSNNNTIQANTITNNTNVGVQGAEGEGTGLIFNPFLELANPRRGESLINNNVINNIVRNNVNSGISVLSNVGGIIRGNTVEHNGFSSTGRRGNPPGNGIGVFANLGATQSTQNIVDSNIVSKNFDAGIQVQSNDNRLEANTATNNGGPGIELFYGDFNHVLNNTATGNTYFDLLDHLADCGSNIWRGNVWRGDTDPPCTQIDGHQSSTPASSTTSTQSAASPTQASPTLRGRHHG